MKTELETIRETIVIQEFILWLNEGRDLWLRDDDGQIYSASPLIEEYQKERNQ